MQPRCKRSFPGRSTFAFHAGEPTMLEREPAVGDAPDPLDVDVDQVGPGQSRP
jgi:hypothetical protein